MIKTVLILLLSLACAVICVFTLMYAFQRKLLYPAPKGQLPLQLPAHVSQIEFENGYGLLMLPSSTDASPAIVFLHGNGEWASQWVEGFQPLVDAGFVVMLVEYPGYAGAPGKPSLDTMAQVMRDAFDELAARPEVDASAIISHGRSLGGGGASLLAASRPVAALVLESTFSTLQKLVGELHYPSTFLKDKYDNQSIVASLDIPVFIYHGTEDELIGVHHARELDAVAKNSELILQQCDHNNCPRPWSEMTRFLSVNQVAGVPRLD